MAWSEGWGHVFHPDWDMMADRSSRGRVDSLLFIGIMKKYLPATHSNCLAIGKYGTRSKKGDWVIASVYRKRGSKGIIIPLSRYAGKGQDELISIEAAA